MDEVEDGGLMKQPKIGAGVDYGAGLSELAWYMQNAINPGIHTRPHIYHGLRVSGFNDLPWPHTNG